MLQAAHDGHVKDALETQSKGMHRSVNSFIRGMLDSLLVDFQPEWMIAFLRFSQRHLPWRIPNRNGISSKQRLQMVVWSNLCNCNQLMRTRREQDRLVSWCLLLAGEASSLPGLLSQICPLGYAHQPTSPPAHLHLPTLLSFASLFPSALLLRQDMPSCSARSTNASLKGASVHFWQTTQDNWRKKTPTLTTLYAAIATFLDFLMPEENSWSSNFMWFLKLIEMVANSKIVANHEHCWVECCLPNLSSSGRSSIDLIILRGNEIFEADKKGNCCMFPLNGRFNPGGEVVWWDDSTKGAVLSSKVAV